MKIRVKILIKLILFLSFLGYSYLQTPQTPPLKYTLVCYSKYFTPIYLDIYDKDCVYKPTLDKYIKNIDKNDVSKIKLLLKPRKKIIKGHFLIE